MQPARTCYGGLLAPQPQRAMGVLSLRLMSNLLHHFAPAWVEGRRQLNGQASLHAPLVTGSHKISAAGRHVM